MPTANPTHGIIIEMSFLKISEGTIYSIHTVISYIDCLLSFPCYVSPWCHNWLWGLILHTSLWTSEEPIQITQGLGTVGGDLLCPNVQLFSKCFLETLRYAFFCIKCKSWVTGCSHKHQGDRADLSDWQLVCDQQRRVYIVICPSRTSWNWWISLLRHVLE